MRMPKGVYDRTLAKRRASLKVARAAKARKKQADENDWLNPCMADEGEPPYTGAVAPAAALDDFCTQVEQFWANFGRQMAEKAREALNG
jgi:hypothetical protein